MATSNNSSVTLIAKGNIKPNTIAIGGGRGGVSNYELLTHKPSINGHELIGNKTNADLGIPTDTQDLTNTAGFITKIVDDLVNYYTKLEIDDIINEIKQSSFRIVDDLPLVGDPGVIYLILNATPQSRNYYDEYIYTDNRWEKIGTTEIDLSGYVTDEELTQVLRSYITNEVLNETLRNYYNKADVNLLLADKANSTDLAAVATSGSYNDLQNKPDIPDDLADLNEDSTHRLVTDVEKSAWNNKSDFSGSYNDLTDKPTIPDELADLTDDATHRLVTDTEKQTWNDKSDFSGSYDDLTDKPDIPTVHNSTVTIQKNNQNIDSFTLNQSSNKSINIDVPEKTSDIQNDSGFITNTVNNLANYYLKTETYTKTEVSNLINAAVSGRFQKVNALPAQGEANVIYLVPKATVLVDNIYDEYIWEDGSWELIGDTQIDLSGYVTDADLTAALQNYVTSATFNTTISNYYTKTEVGNLLADKVDKIDGKGLSTYDYDAAAKGVVDGVPAALNNKVDKVDGKGLSSNDYTTVEKDKLAGIAEGAEVNVQPDWDETDDTQDDYIKNKPEAYDAIWQNNDLLSGVSDVQPYLYRATDMPDGSIPYVQEKLIGASAAVNQIVKNGNFESITEWVAYKCTFTVSNNIATITSNDDYSGNIYKTNGTIPAITGHKYLFIGSIKSNNSNKSAIAFSTQGADRIVNNTTSNSWVTFENIINCDNTRNYVQVEIYAFGNGSVTNAKNIYVIDLTQMFGTAIADLAYSKEQASAGSGIAWLKSYGFFTKDYYPYNTGALQSVKTESKKVVGKNLLEVTSASTTTNGIKFYVNEDKSITVSGTNQIAGWTGFTVGITKIYKNITYIANSSSNVTLSATTVKFRFDYYDKDMAFIGGFDVLNDDVIVQSIPENAEYAKSIIYIYSSYAIPSPIIIKPMLRISGSSADYKPYTSTTYPLDSDLELRGLYKLDASNNIVCDGDEYTPDGSVKRRYGIVDLGTLSWGYYTAGARLQATVPDRKYDQNRYKGLANWSYSFYDGHPGNMSDRNYTFSNSDTQIYVRDSTYGTDATAFKTAMSGVYLIYELATETTDTAASYQNPQIIHENGTEEFIDTRDYPLPVGHDTGYFTASDEKFFLPPVVDNDGRFLYHDDDGFQFKNFNQVASKVEESDINGNIKINGTETQVYDDSEIKGELTTDTTTIEGNPLNFTTLSAQKSKSTIIDIEPIQDLHGYDKPWVGGAGKNKINTLDREITNTDSLTTIRAESCTAIKNGDIFNCTCSSSGGYAKLRVLLDTSKLENGETYTFSAKFDNPNSNVVGVGYVPNFQGSWIATTLTTGGYKSISFVFDSSWTTILFGLLVNNSETPNTNIVSVSEIQLEKASSKSDYEPYENICPISGRTEIGILGCGKNLWKPTDVLEAYFNSSNPITSANGARTAYIKCEANQKYVVSKTAGARFYVGYTKDEPSIGDNVYGIINNDTASSISITTGADAKYLVAFVYSGSVDTITAEQMLASVQIEKGETKTTYSPYTKSNDLTISLGQTVYGGTLDVENGVLVVDRAIVDLGSRLWRTQSMRQGRIGFITENSINNLKSTGDSTIAMNAICSSYEVLTGDQIYDGNIGISQWSTGQRLSIYDAQYSSYTATDFQSAMSGVQLVYELATPITIQLTPNEISLLEGVNNISTTGDKITLTYRNGKVATLGDLTTALGTKANQSDLTAADNVTFRFGKDANGKYGYILNQGGADTVIPFKACNVSIDGTAQSGDFDLISSYSFDPMPLFGVEIPYYFYFGSVVIYNNEIHILGSAGSGNYTKHYKWNGSSWVSVSTIPYSFNDGCAVVYNNEIHILGSFTSGSYTKHYKWDGTSWTSVSTLPYYLCDGAAVILNNEIHILGSTADYTAHYKWDGISWTSVSTLPYDFCYSSAVVLNNEIHIIGSGRTGNYTKHYKWDGSNWSEVSTLPYDFHKGAAVVYNNEIHILGTNASGYYTNHYKWNGSTWSSVSTLPYDFYQGSAIVYNNEINILGGYGYGKYKNHYRWNGSIWYKNYAVKNISLQDISNLISSTIGSTVHCYID